MNGEVDSTEIVPGFIAPRRIEQREKLTRSMVLVHPDQPADFFVVPIRRPRLASSVADLKAGEFVETIGYMLIWASGWIGIGLCLL
jgi:hypothetical protein